MGALTVLSVGLEELRNRPLIPPRLLEGLQDTVEVIADLRRQAASSGNDPLDACIAGLREECSGALSGGARHACERLRRIRQQAADLAMRRFRLINQFCNNGRWRSRSQSAQAHQHLSRLAFWTQFSQPKNCFSAGLPQAPSSEASQCTRRSSREELDDSSPCFPSSAGSAVAVQERLCEPRGAMADKEKRVDLEKLYASFERLDVGCSLGQALRAAEQIADGHAWQLEAAEEDGCAKEDPRHGFQTSLASVCEAARQAALAARQELQHISSLTGFAGNSPRWIFAFSSTRGGSC